MSARKRQASAERRRLIQDNKKVDHHEEINEPSNLKGDYGNLAILFFLYLLQGIPIGLSAAIPMLIQNRGANYKQQAEFSFALWPFSLKLLWAPLVDSLYFSRFGRRKSWMIPAQYLIAFFMLLLSKYVGFFLGDGGRNQPHVPILTAIFFALNFLAATQDIAVDGWALTMLKRCNVGHASTCNSVGQTAGYFLGYVAFMALESKEFCNNYLRSVPADEGLVTLSGFLYFWGITFLITTTLVAIFKRENGDSDNNQSTDVQEYNIQESYSLLLKIIKMKPIMLLTAVLLTVKISFSACDSVTTLKLIDYGIPKEKLALMAVPLVPLQIILPLIISKYTTGSRPMNVYIRAIPFRLLLTLAIALFVYATPLFLSGRNGDIPWYYYATMLVIYAFYQITLYSMFVAVMAFFARISDPRVGGTYMTLLNTLCNLGGNWPTTCVLWLVDVITWKKCVLPDLSLAPNNTCITKDEQDLCSSMNGKCSIEVDGYYIECILCLIYGIFWFKWAKSKIHHLQCLPIKAWQVVMDKKHS